MEKARSVELHGDGKDPATSQQPLVGLANCHCPGMHAGDIKLVSGQYLDCVTM